MSLQNKVAIVTGGSRGIGAGIAAELAKRGAKVLITFAASSTRAEEVVAGIKGRGGEAVAIRADCMDAESPKLVIDTTIKTYGAGIDIIVNNAGAGDELYLKDTTFEHFNKVFITNVRFPIFLVKEALPHLRKGGRIVNLSSVVARQGNSLRYWSYPWQSLC
jgi:3-oxoacyl-[acyl-carrier protein] reductase